MTRRSSSNRAPFTRHRLLGARVAAAVAATSRQANASRGNARAKDHPPRRRETSIRCTPVEATKHRDDHERDSPFERESESACNAVEVTSPELPRQSCPHSQAFGEVV